jgi:hypothetical protein
MQSAFLTTTALVRSALPVVVAMFVAAGASAQDADKFQTWTKVEEARETRDYKDALRAGGGFDEGARAFLTQILPQLSLPANRLTIERVRRRIRELLLSDIADEKSHDAANRAVLTFMTTLARNQDAEPVVRANAMLLVGDLRSQDGKPWPAAATTMATAAGDTTLPMAVRIVALAGLARQAEGSARKAAGEAAVSLPKTATDVITDILTERATDGNQSGGHWRVENDWMAARAASMLPSFTRSASTTTAAALVNLLDDPRRGVNVRVRAAAALGATAVAASKIDAAKAIESIRGLAILALENDLVTVDGRQLDDGNREGGGTAETAADQSPPGVPPNPSRPQGIPEQVCRRAAWRLSTLADAILAEDQKSGLALLPGSAREPAEKLAASLRAGGAAIDAEPGEKSLNEVVVALGRQAAPAAAANTPPPVQPKPGQPKPGEPATEPAASPFENPFGN